MTEANTKAASVISAVNAAAREAREANGDYGVVMASATGAIRRNATKEDHDRFCEACDQAQDSHAEWADHDGVMVTIIQ